LDKKRTVVGALQFWANLQKWGLAQSPSCDCGQRQTINRIVDKCPLTKFEGGLNQQKLLPPELHVLTPMSTKSFVGWGFA